MRHTRLTIFAAAAALTAGVLLPSPAQAAARPRVFANCTQMHTVYKGGVGRVGAVDKRKSGGKAKYRPVFNTALYNANKKSDADHDGIACEQ